MAQGEQERISCFIIGAVHPSLCPLPGFFEEDPLFIYSAERIPAGLTNEERQKLDRLYYPRSRKVLLESYDMMFFADARISHFTPRQIHDLDYAFREGGMSSLWGFGPGYGHAIQGSILSEVLPISDHSGYIHRPWHVVFRRERDPIFLPFIALGMEKVPGEAYARMSPRQGTIVWADMQPLNLPWMVSWRPGGKNAGVVWVCADEFNRYWWALAPAVRGNNPYAIDMTTNLILYSLGRPLISDIHTRREARCSISSFMAHKSTVLLMLEWADMFGANTLPLSEMLNELDSDVAMAMDQYLGQKYGASISLMESVSLGLTEITTRAVCLKDEALFWVFISEWLVVTSTGIIAGVVVWSLMVRRRIYRTAGVTRLKLTY